MNHFSPPQLSWRAISVWRRNFLVWQKLAIPSVLGNLADPMIYMFGLGYGLGSLLPAPCRSSAAVPTSPSSRPARSAPRP